MGRRSKCHKIYTSMISDQKLYPLKNAQKTFEMQASCIFFQIQTVLLPFAPLYYSNLITILTNKQPFPQNYKQSCYKNVKT